MSDEELFERWCARGDRAAFAELYERYFPRLVAFLARFVPRDVAEDLAQEALLKLLLAPGKFDPSRGTLRAWLFQVAWRLFLDYLRRQRRAQRLPSAEEVPDKRATPDELLAREELSAPVRDCIQKLSPKKRAVLLLAALGGLSLAEIARILGISYGAAGRLAFLARLQVSACLKRKGYHFIPFGDPPPPGAVIVMRFPDELLVYLEDAQEEDSP
jgi:RNA polymerase sigma-70 factor (ECF subfamily)